MNRQQIQEQRNRWMRERELNQDKEEISGEKEEAGNSEMMDKLFLKMHERLEERYKSDKPVQKTNLSERNKALENKGGWEKDDAQETLHDQVMSNTCPICFELFLPPDHQPFILFPCGHTFCK